MGLVLAFFFAIALGYLIGSIRGARFASLEERILHMNFASGVYEAIHNGKSDIVMPDSHLVACSLYREIVSEPWLDNKLIIPIVKWDKTDVSPVFLFGVDDSARHLTMKAGKLLKQNETYK